MTTLYTSTKTGNWSDGTVWDVGTVPNADGHLVNIANGHTVTIQNGESFTVGDSTTVATKAIDCGNGTTGTGILNISDGGTLTVLSSVRQCNATWTFGRATVNFTNASDGTWQISGGNAQANALLTITGTSSVSLASFSSTSTGIITFTSAGFQNGGRTRFQYVAFSKVGKSGTNFLSCNPLNGQACNTYLKNCTLTTCGVYSHIGVADNTLDVSDNVWSASTGGSIFNNNISSASSSGTRTIVGNVFDVVMGPSAGTWLGCTIELNSMKGSGGGFVQSGGTNFPTSLGNNLMRATGNTGPSMIGDTSISKPNYLHIHNTSSSQIGNFHGLQLTTNRACTVSGWMFDPGNTDNVGDLILGASGVAGQTFHVNNNLMMHVHDGSAINGHCGQIMSMLSGANLTVDGSHNTYSVDSTSGESGAISVGETDAGHAAQVTFWKSNIAYPHAGTGGYIAQRRNLSTVSDIFTASGIDYNSDYGLSAGNQGVTGVTDSTVTPSQPMFTSTTGMQTNKVSTSPAFMDDTRDIATWAVRVKGSAASTYDGKVADAYTAINANPRVEIPALIAWVQAGWRPTNTAYKNAGHDGVTIGALEWISAGVTRLVGGQLVNNTGLVNTGLVA